MTSTIEDAQILVTAVPITTRTEDASTAMKDDDHTSWTVFAHASRTENGHASRTITPAHT